MLQANYFDGRSTRIRRVDLSMVGTDLLIRGDELEIRVPFTEVSVDERLGRAPRRIRFKDGASCEVSDLDGLHTLLSAAGHREGWVDRLQRHLQFVLFSCAAFIALTIVAYRWGLPWAAAEGAQRMPPNAGKALSAQTLNLLDQRILQPSKISEERQRILNTEFQALRLPKGAAADSQLLFRRSPQLGANAFTLPDGTIILLDDLVAAIADDRELLAVLAHELRHAQERHGLQLLLRSSAVGAFWAFYIGDVSSLLAAAPAAVVQARYSREFETRADDYAAALLLNNGMSPALLADVLTRLQASHAGSNGGYLASHPATEQRIRRLRTYGATRR